jgi:hypothetical protein
VVIFIKINSHRRKFSNSNSVEQKKNVSNNSYLCIKGIIRRLWHEGMFRARGTRAFKFPRAIIDNYARGTYVLFYFIISKNSHKYLVFHVVSMQI